MSNDSDDVVVAAAVDVLLDYLGGVLHVGGVSAVVSMDCWLLKLSDDLRAVARLADVSEDEPDWCSASIDLIVCAARALAAAIEIRD